MFNFPSTIFSSKLISYMLSSCFCRLRNNAFLEHMRHIWKFGKLSKMRFLFLNEVYMYLEYIHTNRQVPEKQYKKHLSSIGGKWMWVPVLRMRQYKSRSRDAVDVARKRTLIAKSYEC
jgi:hypothetical protein